MKHQARNPFRPMSLVLPPARAAGITRGDIVCAPWGWTYDGQLTEAGRGWPHNLVGPRPSGAILPRRHLLIELGERGRGQERHRLPRRKVLAAPYLWRRDDEIWLGATPLYAGARINDPAALRLWLDAVIDARRGPQPSNQADDGLVELVEVVDGARAELARLAGLTVDQLMTLETPTWEGQFHGQLLIWAQPNPLTPEAA